MNATQLYIYDVNYLLISEIIRLKGITMIQAIEILNDLYEGEFDNEEDFIRSKLSSGNYPDVPPHLKDYIDYKSMARDWFVENFFSINLLNKVHVFINC